MGEVEDRTAAMPAQEAGMAKATEEFAKYQAEAAERLKRLKADLAATLAELATREAELVEPAKSSYLRLVKAYGADGLAPASGGTCGFCHTGVTAEKRGQLSNGQFAACSSCGRGLYLTSEPAPSESDE